MAGRGTALAAVLAGCLLWGTTGTAQALGDLDAPAAVGPVRLLGGGAALVAVLVARGRAREVRRCWQPGLRGWVLLAAAGAAGLQLAFFPAVATTGVAVGTVVAIGSSPVVTGLLAAVLLGERLTGRWAVATALAVGGCAVLVLGSSSDGGGGGVDVLGVGLALLAGSSYAVYTVAAKRLLLAGVALLPVLTATLGLAALLTLPVLLGAGAPLVTWGAVPAVLWLWLVATALAYVLFASGLRRLAAGTVGTLSLAEPLLAAALGLLLLGERPPALSLAGGAALLLGLGVVARPGRAEEAPTSAVRPASRGAR